MIVETQYVKNNANIKRLFNDNTINGEIATREQSSLVLQTIIDRWQEFDNYCIEHPGITNFWTTLGSLIHLLKQGQISHNQFQIALGIQQARWSVDSENVFQQKLKTSLKPRDTNELYFVFYDALEFSYFENIPAFHKNAIITKLSKELRLQPSTVEQHLLKSIWYKVSGSEYEDELDTSLLYYGIPASYDFSSITCLHKPIIVFGSLTPTSLVKFILKHNKRPYVGHLPGSPSNLTIFDDIEAGILSNWSHDLFHQLRGSHCDVSETIDKINNYCGNIIPKSIANIDWINNAKFIDCIQNSKISENLTDNGNIFVVYNGFPEFCNANFSRARDVPLHRVGVGRKKSHKSQTKTVKKYKLS